MLNIRALFVLLALGAPLVSHARIHVVTTTTDLADIVRAVGGDRVEVRSITTGMQDAHFVDAKPSFMLLARKADLFIESGMDLDTAWAGAIVEGSRNPRVAAGKAGRLIASVRVGRLEVPGGSVDRSMGDVHVQGNPHWWLSPANVSIAARDIAERLQQIDPEGAAAYRAQAAAFERRLAESRLRWEARLAPHRGARVFTHHRSWSYLLASFGLESAGEIEPKPGIPATPGHLVGLVAIAKAKPVKAILVEPWYDDKAAKLVAKQTGATVLRLPISSGGNAQAKDWFSLMDHVVDSLAAALAGP